MRIAIVVGGRVAPPGRPGEWLDGAAVPWRFAGVEKMICVVMVRGHLGEVTLPGADLSMGRLGGVLA